MPLHTGRPRPSLDRHSLHRSISGSSKNGHAVGHSIYGLMVVARRSNRWCIDAEHIRRVHQWHVVHHMPVVLRHVRDQGATEQRVDHVQAATHGQHGNPVVERIGGKAEISLVLHRIHVVHRLIDRCPVSRRMHIAAARQEDPAEAGQSRLPVQGIRGVPGQEGDRVTASGPHRFQECARGDHPAVAQGAGRLGPAAKDGDAGAGHGTSLSSGTGYPRGLQFR